MAFLPAQEQLELLERGVVDLHVRAQLLALLGQQRPLKIKAGFDPTRPDLHLGHTVLMNKMRQFQELGHDVVFVVGDFTARIGDPSGRNVTRKVPTHDEIVEGARTYAEQAYKILDRDRTQVVYNGTWLDALKFDDVLRLAGKYTLARMMERDDFKTRWAEHSSISLHELLYPLAQAYDSVALDCDVELGGTDQLFNLLVGREIMERSGQRPQVVMTTPILEGLGAKLENGALVGDKMSKSLDNYVGVAESPQDMFGKLMSISDALMWRYYELLSTKPESEVKALIAKCQSGELNPKVAKVALGVELVARYHDQAQAEAAAAQWDKQFSRREVPDVVDAFTLPAEGDSLWICKALVGAGLATGTTDARRKIEQGAVRIADQKISDSALKLARGDSVLVKVGRKYAQITVS